MKRKISIKIMEPSKKKLNRIGIVGLGLIGGSLGLDLQSLGYEVCGLTHRQKTLERAKERGLVQIISTDHEILKDCSIIIIALPLQQLLNPSQELIRNLPQQAVVTDVGSVKVPVIKVWRNLHPKFIASHPMAGTTEMGVEAGQRNLFQNRPWIITPEKSTDIESIEIVNKLATQLGSKCISTNAEMHDKAVALVSHLPVLISAALLRTAEQSKFNDCLELARTISSTGFADTTRVGGGNPTLGVSMTENNTSNLIDLLNSYRSSLSKLEDLILSSQWKELEEELKQAKSTRISFQ